MDFRKSILYFALAILAVMIFHAWQAEYPTAQQNKTTQTVQSSTDYAPSAITAPQSASENSVATTASTATENTESKTISVKTDVLDAQISLRGGNLVSMKLLQYPVSLKEKNTPVQILNPNRDAIYVAQSGVTSTNQSNQSVVFTSSKTNYELKNNENDLTVTLTGKTKNGLTIQKAFVFKRNSYGIETNVTLTNHASSPWNGNVYNQITRRYVAQGNGFIHRAYDGAAVSTTDTPYKKLTFEDLSENDFSRTIQGGWVAMQQHYFLTAFIPDKTENFHYYSRSFGNGDDGKNNVFILGYLSPAISLAPNASTTLSSTLYVGPEIASTLKQYAKGLDLTVDYGWLWPISKFIFWLMSKIDHYVGNWGWSIILVTLLIKIAFYWFSNKSYRSMAKTRDLQPKIKALRDRYGDDKQAMSKAMMELYRKDKINPLGGCLPMIVQIPVFIALYYVLIESVELRQAPFIFWIHDLSMRDPYFVLPVLMGLTMLLQQKISPPPPDPAQAKMMMFLPVIFTVFFATFPAGLVLYWITNNCASILQQWFVMRMHKKSRAS